jgi:hypothetical protein
VIIVVAGGPSWTDVVTAVGTVGTAIAAVGIAIASSRQTRKQVEKERTYGQAQLEEERRLEREKQQLAEAYQIQVVLGERAAGQPIEGTDKRDDSVKELAALVVNHGSFTITDVEARFCYDGQDLASPARSKRLTGFGRVSGRVQGGFSASAEHALDRVLTPRDAGVRFESYPVPADRLANPYPVVRWTDRWGTRWEHRQGQVDPIVKDQGRP